MTINKLGISTLNNQWFIFFISLLQELCTLNSYVLYILSCWLRKEADFECDDIFSVHTFYGFISFSYFMFFFLQIPAIHLVLVCCCWLVSVHVHITIAFSFSAWFSLKQTWQIKPLRQWQISQGHKCLEDL